LVHVTLAMTGVGAPASSTPVMMYLCGFFIDLSDRLIVDSCRHSSARYLRTEPNTLQKTRKELLVFCVLARLEELRRVEILH
jgi:hypothetical protein